jgi:hypothetical protein
MAQSTLAIIILFSFSKWEAASALSASNLQIWHHSLPRKNNLLRVCCTGRAVYRTQRKVYRALKSRQRLSQETEVIGLRSRWGWRHDPLTFQKLCCYRRVQQTSFRTQANSALYR